MKVADTVQNQAQIFGAIKTIITKREAAFNASEESQENSFDILLKIKNKFRTISFDFAILPETYNEIEEHFPEAVDLEFTLSQDSITITEGFFHKFEIDKTETLPQTPITPQPLQNSIPTQNSNPYTIDINTLMRQQSESNEKMYQLILSSLPKNNESKDNHHPVTDKTEYIEILKNQIAELKSQITEYKSDLSNMRSENNKLMMENVRLSASVSHNNSEQTPESKFDEYVKNYERQQQKMDETLARKRSEIEELNLKTIEARMKSYAKKDTNETEVDRAMADIIRNKVPLIVDYMLPMGNPTSTTTTPTPPKIIT